MHPYKFMHSYTGDVTYGRSETVKIIRGISKVQLNGATQTY